MAETTAIRVSKETWKRLNDLKAPGDSFEEIVAGLLDEHETEAQAVADGGG